MSSDLPGGDAVHEVVAEVLAVTPIDPEGLVITGFVAIKAFDGGQLPEFGEPAPIAARQAAAVLRWAASRFNQPDYSDSSTEEMILGWADGIDPKESRDDRH